MPCTRARSSHTRQRTSSYDEPSAARRPRRGRAHSSAPRGRRAPSLQSTLFIAAPQGHSGRNHSVWGTRAATRHRKRHPPSCVVDPPRASFRPAPLPTDLRPRILYRPPPRAGSYNLRSGSCTYLTPFTNIPFASCAVVGGWDRTTPAADDAGERPDTHTSTHFNYYRPPRSRPQLVDGARGARNCVPKRVKWREEPLRPPAQMR